MMSDGYPIKMLEPQALVSHQRYQKKQDWTEFNVSLSWWKSDSGGINCSYSAMALNTSDEVFTARLLNQLCEVLVACGKSLAYSLVIWEHLQALAKNLCPRNSWDSWYGMLPEPEM